MSTDTIRAELEQSGQERLKSIDLSKNVFTTGEAALICNISQQTIIRSFDSGRLTGFRVPGSRFRRILREELVRFMRTNNISTDVLTGSQNRRILIVDEAGTVTDLLVKALSAVGHFDVRVAEDCFSAGMMMVRFVPDVVLVDYCLGGIDVKAIRDCGCPEMKIMILSAVLIPGGAAALSSFGAYGFVKKPFNIDKLVDVIAGFFPSATA